MKEMLALIVLAFALPVSPKIIVIAGLVIAVIILVAAIYLFRSSGKKKAAKQQGSSGAADWQRGPQQQQAGQGVWQGMPGPEAAWNQGAQAQQGWGAQSGAGGGGLQAQQQPGWNTAGAQGAQQGWGMPTGQGQNPPQQAAWGAAQGATQQANGWGMPVMPGAQAQGTPGLQTQQPDWNSLQSQQPGAWAAPSSPTPPQSQPQAAGWGASTTNPAQGTQSPWDAAVSGNQGNSWGQSIPQTGMPSWNQQAQPAQQAQTAYGGSGQGWGMGGPGTGTGDLHGQADMWNQQAQQAAPQNAWAQTAPPQQAAPAWGQPSTPAQVPSQNPGYAGWQQQQPQQWGGPAMGQDATLMANDADKTIMRPTGMGTTGYVRVEEGKEPGRIYEIKKDALSIGRSRESDIFLEDLAVSRLHASIVSLGNGDYALKDEGSANGTKVNGQMVNKYQSFPLKEGDKIQLGQTVLVFAKR
jgi:hypothetical protein